VQEERHDLKSGDSVLIREREREREDDVRDGKRFVDGVD
jgi:mRNA degradation ribonuclease J1/J2